MCRICCYIGSQSLLLAEILTKPEHSILKQSKSGGKIWSDCGLAVNTLEGNSDVHFTQLLWTNSIVDLLNHLARNSQLNGDGCGIGWYTDDGNRHHLVTFYFAYLFLLLLSQTYVLLCLPRLLQHGTTRISFV